MSKIFRKHSSISCFYCQSPVDPLPRNPRSFRCPNCDCWNRYDSRGEIISDEPAMYDENLNARSFARRGEFNEHSSSECRLNHTCCGLQLPQERTVYQLCTAAGCSAIHVRPTKCCWRICFPATSLHRKCVATSSPPPYHSSYLFDHLTCSLEMRIFLRGILHVYRIPNTSSARRHSQNIGAPSRCAILPYVQIVPLLLKRKFEKGTTWPVRVPLEDFSVRAIL